MKEKITWHYLCKTCTGGFREAVEYYLLYEGLSQAKTAEKVSKLYDVNISQQNVCHHFQHACRPIFDGVCGHFFALEILGNM